MKNSCILCGYSKRKIVWNDKIRISATKFSKKKFKILKCQTCDLVELDKKSKKLQNSAVARNLYNKNNSIKEFLAFHTSREVRKIDFVKKYLNFKNKRILESNCGAGIIINYLKKYSNFTYGIDDVFYKKFLESQGHIFFKNIKSALKEKSKFDIILSFSELEHKYDPIKFLKDLKKILSKDGKIVLRVPNYFNLYMFLLGKNFLKYDYRQSHNFYFSEKNLDMIFNKLNFKIQLKMGMNEYDFNHILTYLKKNRRIKNCEVEKIFNKSKNFEIVKNIEDYKISTSLIYIVSNV